jgi:hypothetical protein
MQPQPLRRGEGEGVLVSFHEAKPQRVAPAGVDGRNSAVAARRLITNASQLQCTAVKQPIGKVPHNAH